VKNAESLQKMGVTHVLNMAQELKLDQRKLSEKNIKLMYIAAKDAKTYNIRSDFDTAFKFIDDALVSKGKIVINCARGISRSATIVIAYLMFRYKMSLMDSFGLIVRLRPQVRPNSNFRRQLQLYEQELLLHHHHHHHQKYNHTITKKY
jgi:dual specificity phosphatase 12